jgi:hypothetical protein
MAKLTTLTLSAWNTTYGKDRANGLYVVNNSKNPMDIVFNIKDVNGAASAVMVPYSAVPVDLTVYATINNLMDTPDFRRLINNQILLIVDNEEVEQLKAKDPILARQMAAVSSNGSEIATNSVGTSVDIKTAVDLTKKEVGESVEDEDGEPTNVEKLLELAKDDSVSADKLESLFLSVRDELTEEDKDELLSKTKNDILLNLLAEIM